MLIAGVTGRLTAPPGAAGAGLDPRIVLGAGRAPRPRHPRQGGRVRALVLITPLALTIAEAGSGAPVLLLVQDRVVDTVVGAAVALGVLVADLGMERLLRPRTA
ncbi:MAG TPA: hypothetical protein VIG76_04170 [Amnibacterium sp.]|uniref:hypothetical protein n=1 Tax=Amnibacterium sp. TaxID=1872496 RepID=UPI002F92B0C8